MTKKEKKARVSIAGDAIVSSSIPEEIALVALIATAADRMLRDIDDRIRAIYATAGIIGERSDTTDSMLTGLGRYSEALKGCVRYFEQCLEPKLTRATYNAYGAKAYDRWFGSAATACRLLMLMRDRGCVGDQTARIEAYMKSLESAGKFSEDDLKRMTINEEINDND